MKNYRFKDLVLFNRFFSICMVLLFCCVQTFGQENQRIIEYKGTVIEQEVGERSVLDVLIARQALLNSEISYFNKQKDREIVKTQIMYLAGILNLENLEVN